MTDAGVPLRRLWTGVLCGYLALGATLQELPGYVVAKYGSGPATAGLLVGVAFAAAAGTRPFAGRAGDAGRARTVVLTGGVLTSVAGAGHLLAPDAGTLLVARLLMGIGEGMLFSASLPWVLAATPADRRGRVSGWFGLSMWGGLTLGPLLAVVLHGIGGARSVWVAVIALPIVSAVLAATTRRPPPPGEPVPVRPRSWREILPRGAGLPGLCLGMAAYGYGSLTALLVLYLGDGVGGQDLGLAVFAIAFLLTRSFGSPMVDRYGGAAVARIVLLVECAGLTLLATVPTEFFALLGSAITGVGIGTVFPATTAMTLQRTGAIRPGTAVGSITSLWDLGILAAGPIGGVVAAHFGYRPAFALAAGVAIVACGLTFVLVRDSKAIDIPPVAARSRS
ncbi:MFS transporter [Amycolatopsis sp. NPDC058986]|uniref:MFS transporter n=1 Tax=unclassified Amycolatopsis TaxID=2618356 RepID=UPI00366E2837